MAIAQRSSPVITAEHIATGLDPLSNVCQSTRGLPILIVLELSLTNESLAKLGPLQARVERRDHELRLLPEDDCTPIKINSVPLCLCGESPSANRRRRGPVPVS